MFRSLDRLATFCPCGISPLIFAAAAFGCRPPGKLTHNRRKKSIIAALSVAVHESGSGTKRTCRGGLTMPAPEGETDVPREPGHFRF